MTREALRHRWRSCGRKIGFLSRGVAEEHGTSIALRRRLAPGWFEAYECPYCGQYHIGHVKAPPERKEA